MTEALSTFFALSALVIFAAVAAWATVWLLAARVPAMAAAKESIVETLDGRAVLLAWVVAALAMLGSLYYSEIADYVPCEYCWYQRIAMYPMAVILGIAALRRDDGIWRYAVPLSGIGAALSTYHYLMQQFPDLSSGSCSAFAPCTAAWVWEFGFVSIPLMALAAFGAITALLLTARAGGMGNH